MTLLSCLNLITAIYMYLQFRLSAKSWREATSPPLSDGLYNPVDDVQNPQTALIASKPPSASHLLLSFCFVASVLVRLPQPKYMARDLRSHARLGTQACDRDHGGEHTADFRCGCGRGRISE